MVQYPTVAPTVIACSTTISLFGRRLQRGLGERHQTGSAGPGDQTGANFDLSATAISGYDGTPVLEHRAARRLAHRGTIGGVFAAAPVATGIATGNAFFYSEVGNFGLNAAAVYDQSFRVSTSRRTARRLLERLVGGKMAAGSSSAPFRLERRRGFGRFIPTIST